jgi:hypothetical protein
MRLDAWASVSDGTAVTGGALMTSTTVRVGVPSAMLPPGRSTRVAFLQSA